MPNFDTPEEAADFYEKAADSFYSALMDIYEILDTVDAKDMTPRMLEIWEIVDDFVGEDEPHPHEYTHVTSPWGSEMHVEPGMVDVVQSLWNSNIAILSACEGSVDTENRCEEHAHQKGFVVGRPGYKGLVNDVVKILKSHNLKNVEIEEIENEEIWIVKFDARKLAA